MLQAMSEYTGTFRKPNEPAACKVEMKKSGQKERERQSERSERKKEERERDRLRN